MDKKKVVLAFSGGLDTSYCALYLSKIKKFEVHALTVNTGGFTKDDIEKLKTHAKQLNVASFTAIDVQKKYYDSCIKFLIFGNVLKYGTYPLSVSAERIIQAITVANFAKKMNANAVAHGSTSAGNDQIRFDLIFNSLIPNKQILTPIRDQNLSRKEEVKFLKKHGIKMNYVKANYSINKGLWGTSVGGKETLTSNKYLPENAWPTKITKSTPKKIALEFSKGELVKINNIKFAHPSVAINYLQNISQPYGIGRDIHVGDTIIGIKGRVGFEAAAPLIIIKAHQLLEKHILTKWQIYWKELLSNWYGNWLHEGQLLDPTMRNIEKFLIDSQKNITGKVFVTLYKKRFELNGIESKFDLMQSKFGKYGERQGSWSGDDVKGFTKIFGNQNSIFNKLNIKYD